MAVVYQHIRLDTNQIFYIGIGKDYKRAYSKNNRNLYWKHIINTIEYKIEILFEDLTWEEACLKEIELIKFYGRKDLGLGELVNLTYGGDGRYNYIPSDETIIKMSKPRNNKPKKTACIHCGLECAANTLKRYHNDKCKKIT